MYHKRKKIILKKHTLFVPLTVTFLTMLIGMSIYELLKQFMHYDVTIWESHIYTIIFSSVLATVGAYFIIRERTAILDQTVEEITKRKQAEEELTTAKGFLDAVLDNLRDSLFVINPANYTILGANKTSLNSCGLDKDTVIGKHCYELIHHRSTPCSPPNDICPLSETLKTGKHSTMEHIHYDRTGSKIYVKYRPFR